MPIEGAVEYNEMDYIHQTILAILREERQLQREMNAQRTLLQTFTEKLTLLLNLWNENKLFIRAADNSEHPFQKEIEKVTNSNNVDSNCDAEESDNTCQSIIHGKLLHPAIFYTLHELLITYNTLSASESQEKTFVSTENNNYNNNNNNYISLELLEPLLQERELHLHEEENKDSKANNTDNTDDTTTTNNNNNNNNNISCDSNKNNKFTNETASNKSSTLVIVTELIVQRLMDINSLPPNHEYLFSSLQETSFDVFCTLLFALISQYSRQLEFITWHNNTSKQSMETERLEYNKTEESKEERELVLCVDKIFRLLTFLQLALQSSKTSEEVQEQKRWEEEEEEEEEQESEEEHVEEKCINNHVGLSDAKWRQTLRFLCVDVAEIKDDLTEKVDQLQRDMLFAANEVLLSKLITTAELAKLLLRQLHKLV